MLRANTVALQQMEITKRPINQGYSVDVPDACPTCHRHSEVALIVSNEVDGGGKGVQNVAERCLWLGNDETHYLRKWADRDVDDLVGLIKLAMHWIEIDHLSKSCVKEMPSK